MTTKKQAIQDFIKEHHFGEPQAYPDYEGEMAKSQIISIAKNARDIYNMLDEDTQLEAWVQSKITKAEDYLTAVSNYLHGQHIQHTDQETTEI